MTSLLEPTYEPTRFDPVGDWHPTRYTDTLTGDENFTTQGDKLLALADRYWTSPEGRLELDEWQRWLIRRVLETYPPDWPVESLRGQLRYKYVVISMARQNGKSVIGALLLLYFLTGHLRGARVGSFASIEAQANIVYERLRWAVDHSDVLSQAIKTTKTRGISRADGTGVYSTFPAKEDSLQGEPFTAALYDELHLGLMALWDAIVNGQRSKRGAILVGITTAGDDDSLLLKRLYDEAAVALRGDDERMGVFIWEAADAELTTENMIAANPAVACGRIPLDEAMADAAKMWVTGPDENGVTGRDRVIRYLLNLFVDGASNAWISSAAFSRRVADFTGIDRSPFTTYALDRTEDWRAASITAQRRHEGGRTSTELVATITNPTEADLFAACRDLASLGPSRFAMPSATLKPLGRRLKEAGYETWILGTSEMNAASAATKAAITQGHLDHPGDLLTRVQSSRAKPRKYADGWRIDPATSIGDIDAVNAMIAGVFVAETAEDKGIQLF